MDILEVFVFAPVENLRPNSRIHKKFAHHEFLGDFVHNFFISSELVKPSRDSLITPGAMSHKRSMLINNNVFAWLSVQNSFHKYIRLECPSAKTEIDPFIALVRNTDENICTLCKIGRKEKQHILRQHRKELPRHLLMYSNLLLEQFIAIPRTRKNKTREFFQNRCFHLEIRFEPFWTKSINNSYFVAESGENFERWHIFKQKYAIFGISASRKALHVIFLSKIA